MDFEEEFEEHLYDTTSYYGSPNKKAEDTIRQPFSILDVVVCWHIRNYVYNDQVHSSVHTQMMMDMLCEFEVQSKKAREEIEEKQRQLTVDYKNAVSNFFGTSSANYFLYTNIDIDDDDDN